MPAIWASSASRKAACWKRPPYYDPSPAPNALQHGPRRLASSSCCQDLFSRFQPDGLGEEKLVLRIGLDQWRLDRAIPLEAGIYRDRFQDVAVKDKVRQRMYDIEKEAAEEDGKPAHPPPTPLDEGDLLARAFNVDCEGADSFTKLARYEGHLERSIDRCLRQLKKFQAARNTPDPGPPETGPQSDPEPPSAPQKADNCETNPQNGGTAEAASARPSAGLTSTPFVDVGAPRAPETQLQPPAPDPWPRCAKRDPETASAPQKAEYYETNQKMGVPPKPPPAVHPPA